ncbi:MFS transporter [Streptomyces zaomyceticus]|uniref:MFS transporter n=1 Tax=Streptomyces zaomyceticus TaxID=68286 RepID=UPI0016789A18|nr:MFS transporter [Streptomyces zaomyceticus]
MLSVLRNPTYRRLFGAQVVALTGTGLATVALSLLAYDLAGANATAVLGTALAIKMAAYVVIAPIAGALAHRVPRRTLLVSMDLARATVVLALPFVDRIWQVYALILLLQAASAAFTPAFQATIPQVLPDEREYTEALSLARLAYDLESLASPVLAAVLLTVVPYGLLFTATAVGFLLSGLLVRSTTLPDPDPAPAPDPAPDPAPAPDQGSGRSVGVAGTAYTKAVSGIRLLLASPRLRALLALDLAVAAAGAVVLVDSVILVRDTLGRPEGDLPLALGAYGAGSMAVALLLPRALARGGDRAVMTRAALVLPGALGLLALGLTLRPGAWSWPALLVVWLVVGAAGSAVLTPGGRVVRRCVRSADLPAVFAARFSLSHVCWLLAYPLAGGLAATAGPAVSAAALTVVALVGAVAAARLWPAPEPDSGEGPDAGTEPEPGAEGAAAAGSRQRGSRISRPSRTTSRP